MGHWFAKFPAHRVLALSCTGYTPAADPKPSNRNYFRKRLQQNLIRESEQSLGVDVSDLFLVGRRNGQALEELPTGFHVGERVVGGEHDPVDPDHVDHGLVGVERQAPTGIGPARLLAGEFAGQDAAVEVLPQIFLDGPLESALLDGNE